MKFTTLKIENFLAITKAEVNLKDRGLVLIQGANLDDTSATSNGAGKSSIADALCWVLYGTTAREVTGDDVVNDTAGKGTMVQVDIEDGDDVWRIKRHRKYPKLKDKLVVLHLLKDGTINDETKGTDKLTQVVVDKVVGASHEVFVASMYAGQEKMPDLPAMTDKNIKILVEEAAGVTLLEEAYKEARQRLNAAAEKVTAIETSMVNVQSKIDLLEDQITTTEASAAGWEADRKSAIARSRAELGPLVASVKALDAEIAFVDQPAIEGVISDCDASLAAVKAEQDELAELNRKLSRAEMALASATASVRMHRENYDRDAKRLEGVKHKVGCPCDECGRPLTESELAAATSGAQKVLAKSKSDLRDAKQAFDDAKTAAGDALQRRDAYQASMTDVSQTNAERASAQAALDDLAGKIRSREIQAQRARAIAEDVKKLAAAENPHTHTIAGIATKVLSLKSSLEDLADKHKSSEEARAVAESVSKVFSPAGVRAHILDEVTPFLNQQTAKYLSILSDGNIEANWTTLVANGKGELREKFSIDVTNAKGGKLFKGISGGEKRKVRIATALALQDLVATRASKPIELFIGDEIDDALDPAGLERLMQILEEKAQERGSVFIISHNSLTDWVSQIMKVEKQHGETRVTETTT